MEENKVTISSSEYAGLISTAEQYDTLIKMIFIDAGLNYDKTALISNDFRQVLDYLKIIKPEVYKKRFNELKNELVNSDQTNN